MKDKIRERFEMDDLHAAELLYRHNEWRRGNDAYDMANPKELGAALDIAIHAIRATSDCQALVRELVGEIHTCDCDDIGCRICKKRLAVLTKAQEFLEEK